MKKTLKKAVLSILWLIAVILLIAGGCKKIEKNEKSVTTITLTPPTLILYIGDTAALVATVHSTDIDKKTIIWTSSNNTVATVDNGKVTAIKQGTAIITVATEEGNHKATCSVEVLHPAEPEMVFVEGGTFMMGCSDEECFENELPQHRVTVSSFKIAKFLVTRKQWKLIIEKEPLPTFFTDNGENIPIPLTDERDIQKFIEKLNEITGKNYRLPTEAEWEYAARGGNKSKGYKYSGSNDVDAVAWHYDNCGVPNLKPVGIKEPNELGIYDMSGNVWELCQDWYGLYTENTQTNPQGPDTGTYRVLRGGSYYVPSLCCRVSCREHGYPDGRTTILGIRLVLP